MSGPGPRNPLAVVLVVAFGFLSMAVPIFASSSEQVLFSFCYGSTCGPGGNTPYAGVIFDAAGNLYGTTSIGDGCACGVVYELMPGNGQWTRKTLHVLSGNVGSDSMSSLIFDPAGNLYGTASDGGAYHSGTVYELTPNNGKWNAKVLHSFGPNTNDGAAPYGSLAMDGSGNLYGTTYSGGTDGVGTVFELMNNNGKWTHKVLHEFSGKNGANPQAGVTFDAAGNLYGTTYTGGTHNLGTAFELMPSNGNWTYRLLYNFDGKNGANPEANVILDPAGKLYGTTYNGGSYNSGTVFEMIFDHGQWKEKVLRSFTDTGDGGFPVASLVFGKNKNLYGTTYQRWRERYRHCFRVDS